MSQEYDIKWRRDSDKPRPEDELDADGRRDALQQIFEELDVEGDVETVPVKRRLGGDLPYYTIANLVVDSIPVAILLVKYIENRGDEVTVSDEIKEQIDEYHETAEADN